MKQTYPKLRFGVVKGWKNRSKLCNSYIAGFRITGGILFTIFFLSQAVKYALDSYGDSIVQVLCYY